MRPTALRSPSALAREEAIADGLFGPFIADEALVSQRHSLGLRGRLTVAAGLAALLRETGLVAVRAKRLLMQSAQYQAIEYQMAGIVEDETVAQA